MRVSEGWRRALSFTLVAAAFLFLAAEIYRNIDELGSFRWEVRAGRLVLSTVVLSAVLLWGVAVWQHVLRKFGVDVPFRALARAWFLSNLSKYIPGVVWQFVSLAQLGPSTGLSGVAIVTSLLLQMGFLLLASALIGIYLLPEAMAGELGRALVLLRWLGPLALVGVHPRVIRGSLALFARVARRPVLEWQGSWGVGISVLALSAVSWVLYGAAFYLFLLAFVPLPLSALPAVTAINALAFIVGYLAFFAPGGLGFKEAALALLLSGLVPGAVAASLAIAARLWTVAAEIAPAVFLVRAHQREGPRGAVQSAATAEEASEPQ